MNSRLPISTRSFLPRVGAIIAAGRLPPAGPVFGPVSLPLWGPSRVELGRAVSLDVIGALRRRELPEVVEPPEEGRLPTDDELFRQALRSLHEADVPEARGRLLRASKTGHGTSKIIAPRRLSGNWRT
jgi:hypothetical protein